MNTGDSNFVNLPSGGLGSMQMLDDASSESGISMGGSSGGSPSQVRIISHEQPLSKELYCFILMKW